MNRRIFDDHETLSRAAARAILQSGAKSIAVTGGSTPKRLYELLAEQLPQDVTWVLVDERYVPLTDPQSNAAMVERTLFRDGVPERWLRFDTSFRDAAQTVRVFEEEWRKLGLAALDLVLLGCGDDGHTASLFPGTDALDAQGIATGVYVPRLGQWRVTLTLPVIRAAKSRMVLASGESKAPIIREIREGADYPVVRATAGVDSWWFVDRAAVGAPVS
ncbi:MAG TPA: 6-phosphogluconolactonase [Thermoanaerobaculia bacterium]|nr:6-phosphogluconolactonase [Thermoanaerobaculia bacterium]